MLNRLALVVAVALSLSPAMADDVIVTWNAEALLSTTDVSARQAELAAFAAALQPDIVLLQEVTSVAVVTAVRNAMGLTGFAIAVSDFEQDDGAGFGALEVAIISRYPLSDIREFDPFTDNSGAAGEPAEARLVPPSLPGLTIS